MTQPKTFYLSTEVLKYKRDELVKHLVDLFHQYGYKHPSFSHEKFKQTVIRDHMGFTADPETKKLWFTSRPDYELDKYRTHKLLTEYIADLKELHENMTKTLFYITTETMKRKNNYSIEYTLKELIKLGYYHVSYTYNELIEFLQETKYGFFINTKNKRIWVDSESKVATNLEAQKFLLLTELLAEARKAVEAEKDNTNKRYYVTGELLSEYTGGSAYINELLNTLFKYGYRHMTWTNEEFRKHVTEDTWGFTFNPETKGLLFYDDDPEQAQYITFRLISYYTDELHKLHKNEPLDEPEEEEETQDEPEVKAYLVKHELLEKYSRNSYVKIKFVDKLIEQGYKSVIRYVTKEDFRRQVLEGNRPFIFCPNEKQLFFTNNQDMQEHNKSVRTFNFISQYTNILTNIEPDAVIPLDEIDHITSEAFTTVEEPLEKPDLTIIATANKLVVNGKEITNENDLDAFKDTFYEYVDNVARLKGNEEEAQYHLNDILEGLED